MKLIHAKLARSIWLFDIRDMNPKGKDILRDLVSWIKDNYDFAIAPDPENPIANAAPRATTVAPKVEGIPGLTFQRGSFQAEEAVYLAIDSLTIYDDGIVVDSASSTEDADKFALDLLTGATQQFALAYDAETVRKRLYLSELVVRSDINLTSLNPALPAFAERISAPFSGTPGMPFTVGGLSFWSDTDGSGKQRMVRFERQAGRSLGENRYYSDAPMETRTHFEMLEEFERLFVGR
ncbi:MAG: hypothetical protein ABSB15_12945 [Bryobacteraceae bacterium]|jgi:hypothetical protein